MSENQRTLVLIKPDAVERGLVGDIIARLERKGLKITALQMRTMDSELAEAHYEEHLNKPFFPGLKEFMTSKPLVSLIVEGDQAISVVRLLAGATDARKAEPGTIRGDFGLSNQLNLIHASDSEESAKREIDLWFS
ncbi:nucleoside-diphosphate kinase [Natronoglycomyces albus]|uniref:Nucleoside diphosphate kinase n=1 Tax=Natronoglycomyces albus TaxID=2811108 RepID=A0A895XS27_9ACTN|nr:nucleoside-diphosphate kinase [Natronoglycomyces albus]QSB06005.1 nucleoside-diphosphate kinase [Natronoglycomyces albus]